MIWLKHCRNYIWPKTGIMLGADQYHFKRMRILQFCSWSWADMDIGITCIERRLWLSPVLLSGTYSRKMHPHFPTLRLVPEDINLRKKLNKLTLMLSYGVHVLW